MPRTQIALLSLAPVAILAAVAITRSLGPLWFRICAGIAGALAGVVVLITAGQMIASAGK